jgi:hypothetical protein
MAVQFSNGGHEWKGDEPLGAGSIDTGPNPHELLKQFVEKKAAL